MTGCLITYNVLGARRTNAQFGEDVCCTICSCTADEEDTILNYRGGKAKKRAGWWLLVTLAVNL